MLYYRQPKGNDKCYVFATCNALRKIGILSGINANTEIDWDKDNAAELLINYDNAHDKFFNTVGGSPYKAKNALNKYCGYNLNTIPTTSGTYRANQLRNDKAIAIGINWRYIKDGIEYSKYHWIFLGDIQYIDGGKSIITAIDQQNTDFNFTLKVNNTANIMGKNFVGTHNSAVRNYTITQVWEICLKP